MLEYILGVTWQGVFLFFIMVSLSGISSMLRKELRRRHEEPRKAEPRKASKRSESETEREVQILLEQRAAAARKPDVR